MLVARRCVLIGALVVSLSLLFSAALPHSYAQVAPKAVNTRIVETTRVPHDLGTRTAQTTDLATNVTTTAITGGTRPNGGTNLFHSFDFFTVGSKDIAHFQYDMMLPTTNIIARVIGDAAGLREASTIDGILRTNNPLNMNDPLNFGAANLYFINPQGVMFKQNAQLDVGGSVNIATAENLRFNTVATLFDAAATPASLGPLHIASVAAFGFTSPRPVAISIEGSTLQVASSQGLSMIGGDFTMTGGTLQAPGGLIQITSAALPGEVVPTVPGQPADLGVSSFTALAPVNLSGGPQINTSGNGGGTVIIRGSQVALNNGGTVNAGTTGSDPGGMVSITAVDSIILSGRSTSGAQSQILSNTSSSGAAGHVSLSAPIITLDDTLVQTRPDTNSTGPGGTVTVTGADVTLRNGAQISTTSFGTGAAGSVNLTATESVTIAGRDGATIQSGGIFSGTSGSGHAGQVTVSAPTVELTDALLQANSSSTGQAGAVTVNAARLAVTNGGQIITSTVSMGKAGTVTLDATESITLSGRNAGGTRSQVLSNTSGNGSGAAGQVSFSAPTITLDDALVQARPNTSSSTGAGGTVIVTGADVTLRNSAQISTSTFGAGAGGTVAVNTDVLSVATGSTITSGTNSQGAGGTVTLTAMEAITIAGRNAAGTQSQVTSNALSSGNGGQVLISAPTLNLNDAMVQASTGTGSTGQAGTIIANVGTLNVTNGASLNASTFGAGAAGTVNITATNGVTVAGRNTAGTPSGFFSNTSGGGNAGQVVISAPTLMLSDALLQANARTGSTGRAGTITANVGTLNVSNGAQINTSTSGRGAGGTVSLTGTNAVTIAGRNAGGTQSQVLSNTSGNGSGAAGHINISAPTVTLDDVLVRARPDTTSSTGQGGPSRSPAAI